MFEKIIRENIQYIELWLDVLKNDIDYEDRSSNNVVRILNAQEHAEYWLSRIKRMIAEEYLKEVPE